MKRVLLGILTIFFLISCSTGDQLRLTKGRVPASSLQCKELVESLLGRYSVKDEKKYLKGLAKRLRGLDGEDAEYLERKTADVIGNIESTKFYVKELRKKSSTIDSYLFQQKLDDFEEVLERAPPVQRLKKILSVLEQGGEFTGVQREWAEDLIAFSVYELEKIKIAKIGKQTPINSQFAGMRFPMERLSPALQKKYPHGVWFDREGFPVFHQYASKVVEILVTGAGRFDFLRANAEAGLERVPSDMTWHHHQDGKSMFLMPSDIHDAIKHTGGVAFVTKKIKRIKGTLPAGTEWAGGVYPVENLPAKLRAKYPASVKYKINGHPNLDPFKELEVSITSTGKRQLDFRLANAEAGIQNLPPGMTWHMKEDGTTMQLVPRDLLKAIPNTTPW